MDAHRSGDVETPTKKGTFAKIKEAVLSPLKNLSPTKAHADYFEFTKNANSPSLQSKVVMRRNSSRRRIKLTSSPRKGATAPVPFADQTNLQSSETTSVDVCATGVNLSRRESIVLSPPRRASPTRRETICLIPSSRTGTPVPVLPPLSIYQRTPQSSSKKTETAGSSNGSSTTSSYSSKNTETPKRTTTNSGTTTDTPPSVKRANSKKREPPTSITSPAKRRRLSATRTAPVAAPGSQLDDGDVEEVSLNPNSDAVSSRSSSASASTSSREQTSKVITHRKNYTCDQAILEKEKRQREKAEHKSKSESSRHRHHHRTASLSRSTTSTSESSKFSDVEESRSRSSSTVEQSTQTDDMNVEDCALAAALATSLPDNDSPLPSPRGIFLATMPEIIEWFIFGGASEEYLDAFFMAYTHFKVTPQQLLSQLASLYQNPPTSVVGTNAPLTPSVARTKITTFFSKWLSNPLQTDFNGTDAGVLDSYVKFINILKSDNVDIDSVVTLPDSFQRKAKARRSSGANNSSLIRASKAPRSTTYGGYGPLSGKVDLTKVNTQEMATQLTSFEFGMFRAIQAAELRHQAWNRPDREQRAPRVVNMINHFNKISFWVATEIVTAENGVKEQVKITKKFIKLAQALREMGNMNAVMEIISGLNSLPVQRLKHVWKAIPSKHLSTMKKLEELMAPSQNFARYRQELKQRMGNKIPVVPYIGVHLGDIVHVVEGFQDSGDGRIEVAKIIKLGELLVEFRRLQLQEFSLVEDMHYSLYFNSLRPLSAEQLERLVEAQRSQLQN